MKKNKIFLIVSLIMIVTAFATFSSLTAKANVGGGMTCCEGISTCSNGIITIMHHYVGENNIPCPDKNK